MGESASVSCGVLKPECKRGPSEGGGEIREKGFRGSKRVVVVMVGP